MHCLDRSAPGRALGWDWRHWPGHLRAHWTDQLCKDTGFVSANLWRLAVLRAHGGTMWWPEMAM